MLEMANLKFFLLPLDWLLQLEMEVFFKAYRCFYEIEW